MSKLSFLNKSASSASSNSGASTNTLFSVNSGNVNSLGEADLIGEASYNTTTQDNFYLYNKDYPTSRTDGVFTAGYNGTHFEPKPSTFDFATLFSSTNWRITTKAKSSRDVWVRFQKGTSTSGKVDSWGVGWYYTTTSYANRYEIFPSSGATQMTNFTGTTVNFSTQFAYLSVMRDNSTIYVQQSLDNSTWETLASFAVTDIQKEYNAFHWEMGRDALFDMKETNVSINGQIVWAGYETVNILNSLSFKIGDTYPSMIATNGQGTQFTVDELDTEDLSETVDGTYNIFLTPEGETYLLANTVFIQKATPSMNSGDVWFNTSKYPYEVTKYGTEGNFEDIPICQITIATQSNGSKLITASKTYPYNRLAVQAVELSDVSYSGSYNDLTDKPSIPDLTSYSGYDATATQFLKNVEGTLTWVTETSAEE